MNDQTPLPTTLEACHSLIRSLQSQLDSKTRLIKGLMGYDPTDPAVLASVSETNLLHNGAMMNSLSNGIINKVLLPTNVPP